MNGAATALHEGALLIEQHGHVKGRLFSGQKMCAGESLNRSIAPWHSKLYARVLLELFIGGGNIPSWNDNPRTTATEVILALGFAGCLAEEAS